MLYTAIFGGTFNPFHIGHYQMLSALCKSELTEKVLVIPDRVPPHKTCDKLADDNSRIEMCRIACKDFSKAEVSLIEFEREGKSYTIDTVKELKKRNPQTNYLVTCGGDMLASLDRWYKFDELASLVTFAAFRRADIPDFDIKVSQLRDMGANIIVFEENITDISSTKLRNRPVRAMLPYEIFKYILDNGLYNDEDIPDHSEYKKLLKNRLLEKRYYHSLCVAFEACKLSQKYGCDHKQAYLAGLLHDITKNSSKEEHLNIFNSFGIILNDIEMSAEKLWHAISGSAYIKYVLNISDEEIFDAVRYHTTSKADISLLSKIIYLADFTSADRDYEDVDILRGIVDRSLDEAYLYALKYTVNELVEKGSAIHLDTVAAYNQTALNRKG